MDNTSKTISEKDLTVKLIGKSWQAQWEKNYTGKSEEAKELETFLKKNYKGHSYIPWATMQRLLYKQDEHASVDIISNNDGEIIHQTSTEVYREVDGKITRVIYNTFFVKVRCSFLGKVFYETYPVQDNAYNAPNYVDSNMINKALQRAKAKVISAATGLAFKLYEDGDLQFEDDSPKGGKKKVIIKKDVITPEKENSEKKTEEKENPPTLELAKYIIKHKDTLAPILQKVNTSLFKKHNVVINPELGIKNVIESLKHVADPDLFGKTIMKQHENLLKGDKK